MRRERPRILFVDHVSKLLGGAEVDCVVANTSARTVDETLGGVSVHRLASHGMALGTSL